MDQSGKDNISSSLIALILLVCIIIGVSLYIKDSNKQLLIIEVCYSTADIRIQKCDYFSDDLCVNSNFVFKVLSDSSLIKTSLKLESGFYHITVYEDKEGTWEDRGIEIKNSGLIERFGCDGE